MSSDVAVELKPVDVGRLPTVATGPHSPAWWGMVCLIVTESALFATLLLSYFYLRFRGGSAWPPPPIGKPDLALPLTMSVLLLSSSVPMHLAERAIRRGSVGKLRAGLGLAWLLGLSFLLLQIGVEYPRTLEEFAPTTNAYGSLFFTITSLHGLHLAIALLIGLWVQARAWRGAFDARRHVSVQNLAMYWHFVDAVWVFVLLTLYLSPRL